MMTMTRLGLASLGLALAQPALADDATHGKAVFAQCQACHTVVKGARSMVGPNLFGVVGRKAGSVDGFAYSPAMKASGIVWTAAKVDAYLAGPAKFIPGNRMPYAGLANPKDRADLIAYLKAQH